MRNQNHALLRMESYFIHLSELLTSWKRKKSNLGPEIEAELLQELEIEAELLYWYIQESDEAKVKACVQSGIPIDIRNKRGWTPLQTAAVYGKLEIVNYLLKQGAKVNAETIFTKESVLLLTIRSNLNAIHKLAIIKRLRKKKAKLGLEAAAEAELLHRYAQEGNEAKVKACVQSGIPIETRNNSGRTPLQTAAFYGKLEIVNYFLEQGAEVNAKAIPDQESVLLLAIRSPCRAAHQLTIIETLLERLRKKGVKLGLEAAAEAELLHRYIAEGDKEKVKTYMQGGIPIEARNKSGHTPLQTAALYGKLEIVNYLLEQGAEVNAQTVPGRNSVLLLAIRSGLNAIHKLAIITSLWQKGAKLGLAAGSELLHWCATRGNEPGMQFCLMNGVGVDARDSNNDKTPLYTLAKSNLPELEKANSMKMLIRWGGELYVEVVGALRANPQLKEDIKNFNTFIEKWFRHISREQALSKKFIKKALLFQFLGSQIHQIKNWLLEEFLKYQGAIQNNEQQLWDVVFPLINTQAQEEAFKKGTVILYQVPSELREIILNFLTQSYLIDIIDSYGGEYKDFSAEIAYFYINKQHYWKNVIIPNQQVPLASLPPIQAKSLIRV